MGWYNFFVDKGAGERFLKRVKTGIIQERILEQTSWNYLSIYALQHDLENPRLRPLDMAEFLEGVKPALTNFHDVMGNMGNQEMEDAESKRSNQTTASTSTSTSTSSTEAITDEQQQQPPTLQDPILDFTKLELGKWNNQATADPDSLPAQLRGMVTPEYFALLEFAALSSASMLSTKYQDGSSRVQHVALLSARTWEYTEPESETEENNDKLEDSKKESDNANSSTDANTISDNATDPDATTITNPSGKPITRIAAQLEVVYEHTETFTPIRLLSSTPNIAATAASSDADPNTAIVESPAAAAAAAKGEDSPKEQEDAEEEMVTKTSTLVGVFEGWLQGDPSGNEGLRWRLCVSRPAWEFYDSSY